MENSLAVALGSGNSSTHLVVQSSMMRIHLLLSLSLDLYPKRSLAKVSKRWAGAGVCNSPEGFWFEALYLMQSGQFFTGDILYGVTEIGGLFPVLMWGSKIFVASPPGSKTFWKDSNRRLSFSFWAHTHRGQTFTFPFS
ncbi:hypothetical protein TNCV_5070481 [Trichonephila clavipes]|nr:hypothetical protein TNCV_5070481 [Trichonephila clavipes]